MRKIISLFLLLAAVLPLVGCAEAEAPEAVGETVTVTELSVETPAETQQTVGSPVLDAIVQEYGMPFRLFSPTNRDMYEVTVYEGYADRVAARKYEDSDQQDGLAWTIEGDQLTLSGGWSETFTIDLDTMEATSNDDGRAYRIYAEQKIDE